MAPPIHIPGRKVSRGICYAFVPAPLPPKFDWVPRLVRVLSDEDRLIGKLADGGGRLSNPHVLVRPFVWRVCSGHQRLAVRIDVTGGSFQIVGKRLTNWWC